MPINRIIFLIWLVFFYLASLLALVYLLITKTTLFDIGKDGFTADRIPSGVYPHEVDQPLLYPIYPKKAKDYGVIFGNNNNDGSNTASYPQMLQPGIDSLSNYEQVTNNVRDWPTPDNGSCTPAAMCGALYDPKEPTEQKIPEPLPFTIPEKRVGFYASIRL